MEPCPQGRFRDAPTLPPSSAVPVLNGVSRWAAARPRGRTLRRHSGGGRLAHARVLGRGQRRRARESPPHRHRRRLLGDRGRDDGRRDDDRREHDRRDDEHDNRPALGPQRIQRRRRQAAERRLDPGQADLSRRGRLPGHRHLHGQEPLCATPAQAQDHDRDLRPCGGERHCRRSSDAAHPAGTPGAGGPAEDTPARGLGGNHVHAQRRQPEHPDEEGHRQEAESEEERRSC